MKDPHIQARQFFSNVTHPVLGTFTQAGNSFMVDGQRTGPAPAPIAGQHNEEVFCGELGMSAQDLATLAGAGVI
jgi:formyl-CoA transferase